MSSTGDAMHLRRTLFLGHRTGYVCDPLRLVYIRVPKTASSSFVKGVSRRYGWALHSDPVHEYARNFSHEFSRAYKDYRWVGTIRHPLTWLPSFRAWVPPRPYEEKQSYFHDTNISGMPWHDFIDNLKVTPMDWLSRDGQPIDILRTEDIDAVAVEFGITCAVDNPTEPGRKIPLPDDDRFKELVSQKFERELAFY